MAIPDLIALCGNPGAGKSTAAELIGEVYGHMLVDDGKPLREIAKSYLGLTHDQCYTQAGKQEVVTLNNKTWQVRAILGEIGNVFEEKFGGDIIPLMSYTTLEPGQRYIAGSVRRKQGHFWASKDAVVIEIVQPGIAPSPFEFDQYDPTAVHLTVENDAFWLGLTGGAARAHFQAALVKALKGL